MESQKIFSGTVPVIEKALDFRTKRHNLIISNIANMDTPNYKAFDMVFNEEMGKANSTRNSTGLRRTQSGHLSGMPGHLNREEFKVVTSSDPSNSRGDGNTVDIDKEMANMSENTLMYTASIQVLSKKFQGLKNVIQGGNK